MLQPCAQCDRHIDEMETACPFCGAVCAARGRPNVKLDGRLSRAVVFASALVAPACIVNDPPPQYVRQPPPPNDQQPPPDYQQPPPGYAQPPPDDRSPPNDPPPPVADASVRGFVTDANTGRPLANVRVELRGGPQPIAVVTNVNGEYVIPGIVPGQYTIAVSAGMGAQRTVQLQSNVVGRADLAVQTRPAKYDRNNVAKPYGAPPARKRVV